MAGFQIRRQGFKTAGELTASIIQDMLANGFTYVGPGVEWTPPTTENAQNFTATLEAGGNVDPLNKSDVTVKQPWRVNFKVYDNATMGMVVGSDNALPSSGDLPYYSKVVKSEVGLGSYTQTSELVGVFGMVGAKYTPLTPAVSQQGSPDPFFKTPNSVRPHFKKLTEGFLNRASRVWLGIEVEKKTAQFAPAEIQPVRPSDPAKDISASYPMSYLLTITDRGFFLSIWEGAAADVSGQYFSWVLVQRPVDRDTGETITTGKAPVFCVASVGNEITRFVVREADVVRATDPIRADIDTIDGAAIINSQTQVAVSEDNQYVVSFPSRLNTPRYAYTYELDMIGYTSATVVSQNTDVPLKLYGEETARKYNAIHANKPNSNGMRIVALVEGGGIDAQ